MQLYSDRENTNYMTIHNKGTQYDSSNLKRIKSSSEYELPKTLLQATKKLMFHNISIS